MKVLFTGYAPVHFKCFEPIAHRLIGMATEGADIMTYVLHEEGSAQVIPTLDVDLWFVSHTTPKAFPRSYKKCIQIFHGMSFRNLNAREAGLGKDAYFLLGPHQRKLFEGLGEDPERLYNVGFPKTDKLLDPLVMPEIEGAGGRPVVLYAPTGAKHNSVETGLGPDCINALAETGEYLVLVKLHDHPKREATPTWHRSVEHVPSDFDVTVVMKAADLLITDASSVANEYLLLDRPIVFLDVPELIDRAMTRESFDPSGRVVGPIWTDKELYPFSQLVQVCLMPGVAKNDQYARARTRRRDRLFYNPGHATDAAIDVIKTL